MRSLSEPCGHPDNGQRCCTTCGVDYVDFANGERIAALEAENARLRERAKRAYDLLGWCMQLAGGVLNGETGQLVRDFRAEHDAEQRSFTPSGSR